MSIYIKKIKIKDSMSEKEKRFAHIVNEHSGLLQMLAKWIKPRYCQKIGNDLLLNTLLLMTYDALQGYDKKRGAISTWLVNYIKSRAAYYFWKDGMSTQKKYGLSYNSIYYAQRFKYGDIIDGLSEDELHKLGMNSLTISAVKACRTDNDITLTGIPQGKNESKFRQLVYKTYDPDTLIGLDKIDKTIENYVNTELGHKGKDLLEIVKDYSPEKVKAYARKTGLRIPSIRARIRNFKEKIGKMLMDKYGKEIYQYV